MAPYHRCTAYGCLLLAGLLVLTGCEAKTNALTEADKQLWQERDRELVKSMGRSTPSMVYDAYQPEQQKILPKAEYPPIKDLARVQPQDMTRGLKPLPPQNMIQGQRPQPGFSGGSGFDPSIGFGAGGGSMNNAGDFQRGNTGGGYR